MENQTPIPIHLLLSVLMILAVAANSLSMVYPEKELSMQKIYKELPTQPQTVGMETEIVLPPELTFAFPIAAEDWKVTSPYGIRVSPMYEVLRKHTGVDISVKDQRSGMPQVVSIADGTIKDHYLNHETRGKYIVIEHDNGMVSSYAHLSESFIHERSPDGSAWRVKAGEPIGRMGATGLAFGAHLHFELEIDGELVNPMLYINQVLPEWENGE